VGEGEGEGERGCSERDRGREGKRNAEEGRATTWMVRWRQGSRKRNLKCTSMSQLTKVLRISVLI